MQMAPNLSIGEEELAGYVMLGMPFGQTEPFRGIVEKLLVPPEHRNKGIAKKLMGKLQQVTRKEGRLSLVGCEPESSKRGHWSWVQLLDTKKGSPAEAVYPRLGYVKLSDLLWSLEKALMKRR